MSALSRRLLVGAAVVGLTLAFPGPPALASAPTRMPVAVAAGTGTVEPGAKGVIGLGDLGPGPHVGGLLYDSRQTAALAPQETRVLDVLPRWVPSTATGVILTVTAVGMQRNGWLMVWGGSATRPTASALNFTPGTPVPNTVVARLGTSRALRVLNGSAGATHVLVSIQGYVLDDGTSVRAGSFRPTPGARVVDTRPSAKAIPARGYRDVVVAGHGGVPAGATAAALNIVAVKPSAAGYLVAHSPSTAKPGTTTLTYSVGVDRAGLSVVPLSTAGSVRLWNMSSAPVHVVVDSFGWVAAGDATTTPAGLAVGVPTRILDTRTPSGGGALVAASPRRVPVLPSQGSGALLSVTVTGATRAGYLRFIAESDSGRQSSPSFLNFAAGRTVTTSVLVPIPYRDTLHVSLEAVTTGSVHVIVDRMAVVGQRAEVAGTIRSEGSGTAVDGALVSTSAANRTEGVSRADGTYRAFPMELQAVAVCARTGSEQGALFEPDGRYRSGCARSAADTPLKTVSLPLGGRLVGEDVSLTPSGVLTGKVVGPGGAPDVFGDLSIVPVDGSSFPTYARFGTITGRTDGTWQAIVPPGTYVVLTNWGMRADTPGATYLANEVAMGLPYIPHAKNPADVTPLVAAGASTITVPPTATVAVPTLTLLDPGHVVPTIVDPDGDLSDVSIDYVHTGSGYRVWGYPVGSPASSLRASIPLRPGGYAVCVTEGATTVCNDGSSSAGAATPVEVVAGQTQQVTLTLP
ncbi:MAG: hypothetical protein ACJ715_02320 [Ornithinibacter sp.]